jgi:dipeptidyl aminopeptidase/acylaminoacyl peptidase
MKGNNQGITTAMGQESKVVMISRRTLLLLALVFGWLMVASSTQGQTGLEALFKETEISFQAEDGWTIHGTLSIPVSVAQGERVPGVVLIHSPAHDRDIYLGRHQIGVNEYAKENLRTALGKIITLRIDIRGRGKSAEPREYHTFTAEQRARVALDVKSAIEFLSRQERVTSDRIGVVVEGTSADATVKAALPDPRVRAVVLLSGRLGTEAKEMIASRDDLPVLCLVTKEDKAGFVDMTDAYKLSRHPASDVWIYENLGTGNSMFIMWAATRRDQPQLEYRVAAWFVPKLQAAAREVSFSTKDGWTIYANFRLPVTSAAKAPAVVFAHSYLTDRHVFDDLERMLAAEGFAVLNLDFRGRGKSIGKGTYFYLSLEERAKTYLDLLAGIDFLAGQEQVDSRRIAIVGSSIGVKYGLQAANQDERVKAFVALGGMPDREDVVKARFPILFVSSLGIPPIAEAFREFYRLAQHQGSHLLEYEGGAIGYQIFELDRSLEPEIVKWLKPRFLYLK